MGRWLVTAFRQGFSERTWIVLRLHQLTESSDPAIIDSVSGTALYPIDGVDTELSAVCTRPVRPAWGTYACRLFTPEGDVRNVNVAVMRNRMEGRHRRVWPSGRFSYDLCILEGGNPALSGADRAAGQ